MPLVERGITFCRKREHLAAVKHANPARFTANNQGHAGHCRQQERKEIVQQHEQDNTHILFDCLTILLFRDPANRFPAGATRGRGFCRGL
jgi:hypothetical protein